MHTAAKNFEAQEVARETVDALIEVIEFTAGSQGLPGVVAVCANFAHAAHSALRGEALPDGLAAMTISLKDIRETGGDFSRR